MTALTMHRGSRIGRATTPANPWRFNPIRELNRAGVTVVTHPDMEWFVWRPRDNMIMLCPGLDLVDWRWTVSLALAHRAYGHWQHSLRQDIEARDLAARWLINDPLTAWARRALPTYGYTGIAAHLGVPPVVAKIRLGGLCQCLSNVDVYRREPCACEEDVAAVAA